MLAEVQAFGKQNDEQNYVSLHFSKHLVKCSGGLLKNIIHFKRYIMRIEIKTNGKPIKDPDIKALYVLDYAMQLSTDRMLKANLEFAISKWKKKLDKAGR